MFKVFKKEIDFGGKKITLETGKIARQADGAIIATCGETVVLATAVGAKKLIQMWITFLYQLIIKKNIMPQVKYLEDILKGKLDQLRAKLLSLD